MAAIKFYNPRQRLRWHFFLSSNSPPRPSERQKATAAQSAVLLLNRNGPPDTRRTTDSYISTLYAACINSFRRHFLQGLSFISRSPRTPLKDFYCCTCPQIAGKKRATSPPRCRRLVPVLFPWRRAERIALINLSALSLPSQRHLKCTVNH